VKVRFVIDFPEITRAAIRFRLGGTGLATRKECLQEYQSLADADLALIESEFREEHPERAARYDARAGK
jgi:hypothetical protein